jgi:hypothetical protein
MIPAGNFGSGETEGLNREKEGERERRESVMMEK